MTRSFFRRQAGCWHKGDMSIVCGGAKSKLYGPSLQSPGSAGLDHVHVHSSALWGFGSKRNAPSARRAVNGQRTDRSGWLSGKTRLPRHAIPTTFGTWAAPARHAAQRPCQHPRGARVCVSTRHQSIIITAPLLEGIRVQLEYSCTGTPEIQLLRTLRCALSDH